MSLWTMPSIYSKCPSYWMQHSEHGWGKPIKIYTRNSFPGFKSECQSPTRMVDFGSEEDILPLGSLWDLQWITTVPTWLLSFWDLHGNVAVWIGKILINGNAWQSMVGEEYWSQHSFKQNNFTYSLAIRKVATDLIDQHKTWEVLSQALKLQYFTYADT